MEYEQIVAATARQFADEEHDLNARQAELDSAQALLDRETKERHGFMTSARREHELQQVLTREEELAEGHEEMRFRATWP